MTKDQILQEIRRTAAANGGIPLGRQRFLEESGIRESDWSGRFWSRWSEAVREAGFEPQIMNPSLSDESVCEAAVTIVRQLGRFPRSAEIRLACANDPNLPSHNTFRRFGGLPGLRERLVAYCSAAGLSDVLALISTEPRSTSPVVEDHEQSAEAPEGFVYLLKAGAHYKIGKAMSVESRKRQLAIQLPQTVEEVHRIKTDDPYGIEAYWHKRFAEKRLNGEWFALSATDVKAFRRRRFM
ncbi:GIY-YIG nuclease family protein [Gemmatimonas sp.]|uniref:GIY-YIG nuclease family protein n=1 Tax=Gemmatimonas sp. TaxID=1962908 RepID=UPI0025B9D46B|nr:GIY-YIG nuclease family protein [Gemmatimonas sp.]MCA2992984.1 GIY-YIG nuclease family protein [Gemmatimonas sp.]